MSKLCSAGLYLAITILFSFAHLSCNSSAQTPNPPIVQLVDQTADQDYDTLAVVDNGQILRENGAVIVDAVTLMSEASGVNEKGKRVIDSVAAEVVVMTYEIQQTSIVCKDKLRQIKNLEQKLDKSLLELENLQARAARKSKDTKYALNE